MKFWNGALWLVSFSKKMLSDTTECRLLIMEYLGVAAGRENASFFMYGTKSLSHIKKMALLSF